MKISVCMGIYNGKKYIEEQLECIRKQTLRPDEVILCDDGSTDGTREFLQEYLLSNSELTGWKVLLNEQNKGYPGNFYYAMEQCTGDIVFLADQDDVWDIHKIERMTEVMKEREDIKVLGCTFGLIDSSDEAIHTVMAPTTQQDTGAVKNISIGQVFYKCEWPGMVLAYRNDWYRNMLRDTIVLEEQQKERTVSEEQQQERGRIPHDFFLCARAAEENGFCQLEERLAYHRRHDNNAGGEEHRIGRLLNKERKLKEIRDYNAILEQFSNGNVMQTAEGRDALEVKRDSIRGRYEALASGKMRKVLGNAWRHRSEVRMATLVCDVLIVWK